MENKTTKIILGIVLVVIAFLIGNHYLFAITGNEVMTRVGPTSVAPNEQFNITYSSSVSGDWGATIEDSVQGGCTFAEGTTSKTFLFSPEDGNSKSVLINAPSEGNCTFQGNYKYDNSSVKEFSLMDISVTEEGEVEEGDGVFSFDFGMVLFKLGDFEVKIIHLLILVSLLVLWRIFAG